MSRIAFLQNKVVDINQAKQRMNMWRMQGHKVVFTNGCFDIIHKGHVSYLSKAAEYGNRLVVGLNSDNSVKRQGKGDNRPINDEASRAFVIAGLSSVDLVVLFDQDTPLELIEELQPNVLAKGADYDPCESDPSSKKYIVGSDVMKKNGGETVAIPFVDGYSTSSIIERSSK